jgi:hypothetical protein
MKKIVSILLSVSMGLIAGSHGVNEKKAPGNTGRTSIYYNPAKPASGRLNISTREIFTIKGKPPIPVKIPGREFTWPRYLDVDSRGNIYIVDRTSASIKKFDKRGMFIKSFGAEGTGRGQMKGPFMIAILKNLVYVADPGSRRMVIFDTEGRFIDNISLQNGFPNILGTVGDDKFIGFMHEVKNESGADYRYCDLVILDLNFQRIAVLNEYKARIEPGGNDILERYSPYAVGKDEIYVAQNSENIYRIKVFDFNGKLHRTIEKSYKRIPFTRYELDEFNFSLSTLYKRLGIEDYNYLEPKFKKSINSMYYDKKGRLLVVASVDRAESNKFDFIADVFKDGVFLGQVKLDIAIGHDFFKAYDEKIFFKGNRIFYLNETEAIIRVFEY